MSETLGLKNINMLSKEMYGGLSDVATDELYAISGSGFGFPSDRFDDLELGASGTEYTAPANGYFYINKITNNSNQYVDMYNQTKKWGARQVVNPSGESIKILIPVQKDDSIQLTYNAGGSYNFRFIYAEGE